jgi:hypothetical protein
MRAVLESETHSDENALPILQAAAGLTSSKDGKGIGHIVDEATVDVWILDYLAGQSDGKGLGIAFRYGVQAEVRHVGLSFVEAEPEIRSEWSSERGKLPWESVRDAVWAGFDRARDRRV